MSDNRTIRNSSTLTTTAEFSLKATALSHGWHECSPLSWNECAECLQWITRGQDRAIRVSIVESSNSKSEISDLKSQHQNRERKRRESRQVQCSKLGVQNEGRRANGEDRISDFKSEIANRRTNIRGAKARHLSIRIDGDAKSLAAKQVNEDAENASRERIVGDVHRMLGLDEDLGEFYELCAEHPRLAIVPKIGAGRLIKSPTMTENIIKCLCATNINWTQAVKAINRIAQLGPHVRHFRNLTAWPTPREIARAGEKYLVEVCRMGYRAEPIVKFCRDVDSGKFDPESLWQLAADSSVSSDEILKILLTIRGIGPASAHSLLGLLGRHDRVSIDSATIAHVAAIHTNGRKPTLKKIQRIYAPYGKWKNLVYWCESWIRWETAGELIREFHGAQRETAG